MLILTLQSESLHRFLIEVTDIDFPPPILLFDVNIRGPDVDLQDFMGCCCCCCMIDLLDNCTIKQVHMLDIVRNRSDRREL